MAVLGQGLVLMVAGMGIVYLFLTVLIFVAKYASAFVSRFDSILPQDAPKKAPPSWPPPTMTRTWRSRSPLRSGEFLPSTNLKEQPWPRRQ